MNRFALMSFFLLLCSGCASTRLDVRTPEGLHVRVSLPKNMHAEGLRVEVQGNTLTARTLTTDASSVVEAQGQILSNAAGQAASALLP